MNQCEVKIIPARKRFECKRGLDKRRKCQFFYDFGLKGISTCRFDRAGICTCPAAIAAADKNTTKGESK